MTDQTNAPIFSGTIDNPLARTTGCGSHRLLTVGVHRRYTFCGMPVQGMIEIIQQSDDDAGDEQPADFRDLDGESTIVTTANGARALAAVLIKAANAADRAQGGAL